MRPPTYSKRGGANPVYSQQLKTVMENCHERIPHSGPGSAYRTAGSMAMDAFNNATSSSSYLPPFDCDGHNIDDKDYSIPSPPVIFCSIIFDAISARIDLASVYQVGT